MIGGFLQGFFLGLAKAIATKIVSRNYTEDQRAEKADEINKKANALFPWIGVGMAIVLIVIPLAIFL